MTPDIEHIRAGGKPVSASLAGITEAHFWREYVQGQEDVEKGNQTDAASFYLAASQAEAQFADELVTRALGEDSTKEVLAVLQARNAAWGRREDYERRKQQEESRRTGPPIFTDPVARALMGAMAAIIDGEDPQEQDWEKRYRLGQLREAHQVLTADIERRELEVEPVGAASSFMAARRIEVVAPPDPPDPNAFQGEPMSGADACQALGVKDVGSLLRYIRDGRLRARKVKRRTSGRVHLVWEFDSASVVQLQRRPTGRRGAKPKPILLKLAPLHEAIERGELLSLAPEDVREWVVRLRTDAYERQEQASAGRRTAPQ